MMKHYLQLKIILKLKIIYFMLIEDKNIIIHKIMIMFILHNIQYKENMKEYMV